MRSVHHVLLAPDEDTTADDLKHEPLSSETLGVLLDTAWHEDDAMVSAFDLQTTRAGAVIAHV